MLHLCDNGHVTGYRHCPTCLPVPKGVGGVSLMPPTGFFITHIAAAVVSGAMKRGAALARCINLDERKAFTEARIGMLQKLMPKPGSVVKFKHGKRVYDVAKDGSLRVAA